MRRQAHLDPKLVRYARNRQRDIDRQEYARALRKFLSTSTWTVPRLADYLGLSARSVAGWTMGLTQPSEQSETALRGLGFVPPERATR